MQIGVDTGGTFTDLVALDEQGRPRVAKVPTSWPSPAAGVVRGLERLRPGPGFEMAHGTTVATNAFLERRGAPTALVVTRGFGDLLLLGRGTRPGLYALHPRRPPPLVPRDRCFEVEERISADGEVLVPLRASEADRLARRLSRQGIESVAVCLLFSYRNPAHEELLEQALRKAGLAVSLSSRVSPEYREYERASTTALNAYLQPVLARYLEDLETWVRRAGGRRLWVVHSAGAVMSAAEAVERAVGAVLSGPAAGVQGAFHLARLAGESRILTLDMGGTSTDVSLCPGEVAYTSLGWLEGMPVRQMMLDVHTVGAGGGSLARLDAGGVLRVGPESAGSDPGPAAYGRSDRPTVTDAHLVLGRLPARLLGGELPLDLGAAERALQSLARPMGCSIQEAAAGVLGVAAAHMERALRVISVERGYDPRTFTLVAFGGAGPLHAAELARALGIPRVLVPPWPGLLCALGALLAPWMREFSQTVLGRPQEHLDPVWAELEERARAQMGERLGLRRLADLRYRGQGHELTLPWPRSGAAGLAAAFARAHRRAYGYLRPDFPLELVTLRLRATARRPRPRLQAAPVPGQKVAPPAGQATVWLGNPPSPCRCPVWQRQDLRPGHFLEGPGLVVQYDSTTLLPRGWTGRLDGWGNLILEPE